MRPNIYIAIVLFTLSNMASYAADAKCPETIHNSYECAQYIEKQNAAIHATLFSRNGRKLIVKLSNGAEKTYIDTENPDDVTGTWYSFIKYFPEIEYGLIEAQYYEGGSYYLLNMRTGKDFHIEGYPILSPNKKKIVVSNMDIEAGYSANVLSVYEVRPESLVLEFQEKPNDWGPGDLRWINNDEISFTRYSWDSDKIRQDTKKLKYHGVDKNGNRVWRID